MHKRQEQYDLYVYKFIVYIIDIISFIFLLPLSS